MSRTVPETVSISTLSIVPWTVLCICQWAYDSGTMLPAAAILGAMCGSMHSISVHRRRCLSFIIPVVTLGTIGFFLGWGFESFLAGDGSRSVIQVLGVAILLGVVYPLALAGFRWLDSARNSESSPRSDSRSEHGT